MIAFSKHMKHLSSLEELSLSVNEIRNDGISALSDSFKYVSKMRILWINSILLYIIVNLIGDEGMIKLSKNIKNLPKIEYINIGGII